MRGGEGSAERGSTTLVSKAERPNDGCGRDREIEKERERERGKQYRRDGVSYLNTLILLAAGPVQFT